MEIITTKVLKVTEETWANINTLRYSLLVSTQEDVINFLLDYYMSGGKVNEPAV